MICPINMTTGAMVSTINSVAYNAYVNHRTGKPFTIDEQKVIYNDLIEAISEDFYGGKLNNLLTSIIADPGAEQYVAIQELFNQAFHSITEGFNNIKLVDITKRKSADIYEFPAQPSAIRLEVFKSFVDSNAIKKGTLPNQTGDQTEASSIPMDASEPKDVENRSSLIKKTIIDPILTHLKDVVATTWVDGRVRPDGTVRGYTGMKSVANTVKTRLQAKVYDYLATRSSGTFSTLLDNIETKYLVFPSAQKPFGFEADDTVPPEGIVVGSHQNFKSMLTIDGATSVKIILSDNTQAAIDYIQSLNDEVSIEKATSTEPTTLTDFIKTTFTNPQTLSLEDMDVFYSHILTTGKNYEVFLASEYPELGEAYKPKFKTSYSEPGTVNADNQDAASLRMHKQTTPRLIIQQNGSRVMDTKNPYLTPEEYNLVSPELSRAGSDLPSVTRNLLAAIDEAESIHKQNILASIYYRLFSPTDYTVIDKNGNEISMRSYAGIVAKQQAAPMSVGQFEGLYDKTGAGRSPNALLAHSLSAMVTSLRSTRPNDQFGEQNNRGQKSNVTGGGKNIDEFNTDFLGRISTSTASGVVTDNKYFDNDRVVVTEGPTNPDGKPTLQITVRDTEGKEITYSVVVNLDIKEGQPTKFKAGIPLTITDRNTKARPDQIADIFAGFKFPTLLTSSFYRPALLEAVGRAKLENEFNKGTITTSTGDVVDVTLDNLYVNMLFTMLLNGDVRMGPVQSVIDLIGSSLPPKAVDTNIAYNPIETLYGYKEMISDIILHTEGELGSKYSQTYDGNKIAEYIQTSHLKLTKKLASIPTELNKGNVLTDGTYLVDEINYTEKGIKLGDEVKSKDGITEHEKMIELVETAGIQEIVKSRQHNTTLVQIGTQSDRLNRQIHQFKASTPEGLYIKEGENGGWNSTEWVRDGAILATLDPSITPTELAATVSRAQLKILLDNPKHKILYNTIKSETGLLAYGRVLEDENGFAYVPNVKTLNLAGLDVHALARKALQVPQNYYNNLHRVATIEWNKTLGTSFNNLQEIAEYLKANPVSYSNLKAKSELVNSSMIANEKGNAIVPEDILQSIVVFSNDTLGLEYIETMRKMFFQQMADIGYTQLSTPAAVRDVGTIMGTKIKDASMARDIAFNAYFYNTHILGVSALNIHTGGIAQYKLGKDSTPFFNTSKSFTNGRLNVESIISQAKNLVVPGSKSKLGDISVEELLTLRTQSVEPGALKKSSFKLDRLTYIKVILENKSSFPSDRHVAKALLFNDMTRHMNDKFVDQVKRNQTLGTAMQLPRIVGINEPGLLLGRSSKNITVVDAEPIIDVLGMSGTKSVKATDGVQMFHPLYGLKVNNSIGNEESSFRYAGVALKDLTIAMDANGSVKLQKKASFGSFDDDLNRKGSVLVDQALERMNTAVTFTSKQLMVDTKGKVTWTKIDAEKWKTHGLSLGWLKFDNPTGEPSMVHSSQLLAEIQEATPTERQAIEQNLINGLYSTAKTERMFVNIQELWEYLGATNNRDAWKVVGSIIGTHSGIGTTELDLSDANYPNRDAYIEKIGYTSQEKSGSTNVITWDNFIKPDYKFEGLDEAGKPYRRWSEVSNEHHGFILQAEHNYDTTSPFTGLYSEDNAEQEANHVSLITQIISAAVAEGISIRESNNINDTIGVLSDAALEGLNSKVVSLTIKQFPQLAAKRATLMKSLRMGLADAAGVYQAELYAGAEEYARLLSSRMLAKKESDTGLAAELLTVIHKGALTFDQKQLLPLVQSQLFADFNKKTVRMKMPGGQFVVSPSHAFLPSYDLILPHPSGAGNGKTLLSGLNREEMNQKFYGVDYERLSILQKSAVDHSFPLQPITDLNKVKLSDTIVKPDGTTSTFNDIKQEIKTLYESNPGTLSFNEFLKATFASGTYQFRFGNVDNKTEHSNRLKWNQWLRYDSNGSEINIQSTEEYRAYNRIDPIGQDYLDGKTYIEHFELPTLAPVSTKKQTKAKTQARTAEVVEAIRQNVPIGLIKEYYFANIHPDTKALPEPTTLISSAQELEFKSWLGAQNPMAIVEKTYNYIGQNASVNPKFKKRFESKVYNLLQDEDLGWVSVPAETYMPSMHASAFLINEGRDGKPADTLFDLIGLNELPSTNKLESMKILTHAEAIEFGFNYDEAFAKFKTNPEGNYHKLPPAYQDIFDNEYVKSVELVRDHLAQVFQDRLGKLYGTTLRRGADVTKIASAANIFVFKDTSADKMLELATKKRNASIVGSTHYNTMTDLITRLEEAEAMRKMGLPYERSTDIRNEIRRDFINQKVGVLSNNFQKTLEFIMARIPAQGKQSFTHAKIKNFVFSSKNSVYGPLELILLAGLDYDIDKQNMMTWALDEEGNIVDWNQYMINGKLDSETLNQKISDHTEIIVEAFAADRLRLEGQLQDILSQLEQAPNGGLEFNKLNQRKDNIENSLRNLTIAMDKTLEKSEEANREMFTKAGQNFIVHNLIETISSPKNAIEASTPISTAKVAEAKLLPNIEHLFKDKVGLEDLFISQQITTNMNPFSTIQYERINMDGKSGIGIFASDLKAYLAAFYATRMATDEEQVHVQIKTDIPTLSQAIIDKYPQFKINKRSLQFFKGTVDNPTTVDIQYIANANRWGQTGKLISDEAKKGIKLLRATNPEDTESQVKILTQYIDSVGIMNSMNVEEQAWEDLSQLLTAATDNAKELILGKIGANNTTNSVISTMVRMGVDLSDAIPLINSPAIKKIVKEIAKGNDIKVKAAETQRLARSGIVMEDAFNTRLAERLKAEPSISIDENSSAQRVFDYLTNPARTLYTYAKISAEFSALSKLLSINQGLKNSAYEVHAYTTSINDSINKLISDYNDANKATPIKVEFNLAKFVTDVVNKNTEAVTTLIDAMDKIKTGINVPFVLLKNAHYFSYFKALFQAENIRDRISFTNLYTKQIIDASKLKFQKKTITMTDKVYKKISDTIYDFGILSYLEKEVGKKSPLALRGLTYDLSKAEKEGDILGRTELLNNLPTIVDEIKGNEFIDSLKHARTYVDPMTGVAVTLLKGDDLNLIDSTRYARLAKGLRQLREDYPDVYTALFYYGLITTKGGYSGGSFIGLYDINEYLAFSTFLKKNTNRIKQAVSTRRELTYLLNPLLLPQVTTIAQVGKNKYDALVDQSQEDIEYDQSQPDDDLDYIPGGNSAIYWKNLNAEKFILDHLNEEKLKDNTKLPYDFFRSKNNNMVYQWNKTLGIWVPLTRQAPELAIPFTLPPTRQDYIQLDKTAGYTQGFLATIPFSVEPIVDAEGKTSLNFNQGTIVGYITNSIKSSATRYFESLSSPDGPKKSILTPKMLDILASDSRATDIKQKMYIVKPANGDYIVYSKAELEKYNPGYIFEEGFVAVGSKIFSNTEIKAEPTVRIYAKGTNYSNKFEEGAEMFDIPVNTQAHESSPSKYYNQEIVNKILADLGTNIENGYTIDKVNNEYTKYVDQLINNLLVLSNDTISNVNDAAAIRARGNRAGRQIVELVDRISTNIRGQLGNNPSLVAKIKTLQAGEDGFLNLLYKLQGGEKVVPAHPIIDFQDPKYVPFAAKQFITTDAKNNLTQLSLGEFKQLIDILQVDKLIFDSYITSTYLEQSGIDIMVRKDGVIHARKGIKISASKQLASIEDKMTKGKPIYLPTSMRYEYSKPASKAILLAMTKFLNTRLPGVKWNLMTSVEIEEKYGKQYMTDKGLFKVDGGIVINTDKATIETPLHEFGHVYLQYLAAENLPEYTRVMHLAKKHSLYKTMKVTYPNLSTVDLSEEVFCELLSMSGANKILVDKGGVTEELISLMSDTTGSFGKVIKVFTDWIKSMFAKLQFKQAFSGTLVDIELSMSNSLGSIINKLSDDVLFGKESILNNFTPQTIDKVRKTRSAAELSIKEARDILMARGYIEKYCM
jgi:hypothetical protein